MSSEQERERPDEGRSQTSKRVAQTPREYTERETDPRIRYAPHKTEMARLRRRIIELKSLEEAVESWE